MDGRNAFGGTLGFTLVERILTHSDVHLAEQAVLIPALCSRRCT